MVTSTAPASTAVPRFASDTSKCSEGSPSFCSHLRFSPMWSAIPSNSSVVEATMWLIFILPYRPSGTRYMSSTYTPMATRQLPGGAAWGHANDQWCGPNVNLRVAVNDRHQTSSGEVKKDSGFNTCAVSGQQAENIAESLEKGHRVLVRGTLKQPRWTTDSGERRSTVEVKVIDIGAELRFATVEVHHPSRKDFGDTLPASREERRRYRDDEEPF